ncbi:hypothetical protein KHP07_07490 [Pseudomonas sp. VS40]|uniref:hypothetical protein n=1 Tax=unclassified Pseudomonas TaxID=196821 RepID=UPI001BDE612C|nr:hypothetical protein [Pseudomonas sp. VS40]MBT1271963.1 hypothetical protein [Pseudomonas sp. VS59]
MRFITPLLLIGGIATLAGCATQKTQVETMLAGALAQPLVENSIVREGDVLSFELLMPGDPGALRRTLQVEAACSSPQLHLLYLDGSQRVYPASAGRYSSPRSLSPQLRATLAANQTFVRACAETPKPDWRLVQTNERDNQVLIDANSIKTVNGETRFWAAFDNPTVLNDLPYNAPYAQKREHFSVACKAGTYMQLAGYDMDANNRVSDGRVDSSPTPQNIAGSNADYELLFKNVCVTPEKIAALPAFKPRLKAPATIALTSVQPAVLAAITQLNLEKPTRSFKYVQFAGTSNYRGKTSDNQSTQFISQDAPSGQLALATRGDGYESQAVSWRNLFHLVSKATYGGSGMAESSTLTQLSFTGNWKALPVGETVTYTTVRSSLNSLIGSSTNTQTNRCQVERELPASELNAKLAGSAKALSCRTDDDKYKRVSHLYFLTDYAYFFESSTDKNEFFYSDSRIDKFE